MAPRDLSDTLRNIIVSKRNDSEMVILGLPIDSTTPPEDLLEEHCLLARLKPTR